MTFPEYPPDAILSLTQMAEALHLDRKTVVRLASVLGGRRFGRRWRFRWGSAMEVFNANANQGQGNAWLARVIINGQEVDSRIFPPGRKKGP